MVDSVQIALAVLLIVLAVSVAVLTRQIYFILQEFRQTIRKANKVIDNADTITESVAKPMEALSDVATDPKMGAIISVAKVLRNVFGKSKRS